MLNVVWFARRLKAMSIPEVGWRISQKILQKSEEAKYKSHKVSVAEKLFNKKLLSLCLNEEKMHLNWKNDKNSIGTSIPLLGGYNYEVYKTQWDAGFQTQNVWPDKFSYFLEYKQRDDIGDARTNWELNRHFQFAILAKDYLVSGEKKYLLEFERLFEHWNKKNPFLWGISWTSVMEVAIRCSNWCYAWCFLKRANAPDNLLKQIQTGILNMTDYIVKHYSRYSSANNHLIVEAYAIGQTGILCGYKPWIDMALNILTHELPLQNYSDGVNKELSLHYQSFYMEAMGLMMRLLLKNRIAVSDVWKAMLEKMCIYLAECMGDYGEIIAFGDNDEGKILDLQGGFNHYQYVLGLYSFLLDKQYIKLQKVNCENLNWLFEKEEYLAAIQRPLYQPDCAVCYREGGNTLLRSKDHKVFIGIDHAALGFGSIAAHGHADALSFQMYVEGEPLFVDPGTYIYHCDLKSRDLYRKTENHNTVCINGENQSQMLGAFLWGKRAECELDRYDETEKITLKAKHDGYSPVVHWRTYEFDKERSLTITDLVKEISDGSFEVNYIFAPNTTIEIFRDNVVVIHGSIRCYMKFIDTDIDSIKIVDTMYSSEYGIQKKTHKLKVKVKGKKAKTVIKVEV